jgi:microcin C transport system substrate-binding protein
VKRRFCAILFLPLVFAACSSGGRSETATNAEFSAPTGPVSMNKDDYPVFPDKDAGADPAVPADQGGKGFTGDGWETNTNFDLIGDPHAVKGGIIRDYALGFPGTLRIAGPEANTTTNGEIMQLVYETLLRLHPTTLEYIPVLATHWQISQDKLTFRFRIDPKARFSDGTPVTAEDVVASWKLFADKGLEDPAKYTEYNKLEQPVAESKYIVRIKAKQLGWMNFFNAATQLRILPAHILNKTNAAGYIRDYNFKLVPGSGPYTLTDSDIDKGKSTTLRRRKDYWAAKYRGNVGQNNFGELKTITVRDQNLALEMFKKGDLDYFYVNRSKWWIEELNYDKFQNGLLVKKKAFNSFPAAISFMAFNTRRKPWDDIRVRKALTLLFNREQLIEKLFYNEYLPTNSYFPGTIYENPNNPKNQYDREQALKLLAEAGWKDRDAQGRLVKNGQPLQMEVLYSDKGQETWMTVYQDDLRKAGITLNLRLSTPETRFKLEMLHQFDVVSGAWVLDTVFPNPKPEYHSSMADIENSTNISGFKDKRIDEICDQYDVTFDANKRTELIRELDGILTGQYHYIMQWYLPASRLAFWNKFEMPKGVLSRFGDFQGAIEPGIPQLWWVDPAKSQKLEKAMRDPSVKMEFGPVEDRYWQDYAKSAQTAEAK